ncbi:histidine kinase [Spirosoma harenae]
MAQALFFTLLSENTHMTQAYFLAAHVLSRGLMKVIILELIYQLFIGVDWTVRAKQRFRWGQIAVFAFVLIDTALLLISARDWHRTTVGHLISGSYWGLLLLISIYAFWLTIKRNDAISKAFSMGALFMFLTEANVFVYALLHTWPLPADLVSINVQRQILWVERILELLCFSFCLVFYQRQIAVNKAVELSKREEQFEQQRLKTELTLQRLEQEKSDVQLRALQAQVNPHFLFNSLNSLASLIDDDPDRAGKFVNELSDVYRYLLKASDKPLTTLTSELEFINSYYHLLSTRHGRGLSLSIQVDPTYQFWLLPPLTLQLLVENAVKHNSTASTNPLRINILVEKGQLRVRNNLQRKASRVLSNGVGLSTIFSQYQKLQQPLPNIEDDGVQFTVSLPLIAPVLVA